MTRSRLCDLGSLLIAHISPCAAAPACRLTSLVSLILERVPSSVYFSPESLIAHIRTMPCLRTLSIKFVSAVPRPGLGSRRFLPHGQTSQARIKLPVLKQFVYRGISVSLEYLLARVLIPVISDIDITLSNQLTLRIPRICTFISDLELFRPTTARINFAMSPQFQESLAGNKLLMNSIGKVCFFPVPPCIYNF